MFTSCCPVAAATPSAKLVHDGLSVFCVGVYGTGLLRIVFLTLHGVEAHTIVMTMLRLSQASAMLGGFTPASERGA